MELWKVIASLCIIALAVLCILNASRYGKRMTRLYYRSAYRHGLVHGYRQREREYRHAKRVELHDAQRLADARPDAGPSARISPVRFHRRHDM